MRFSLSLLAFATVAAAFGPARAQAPAGQSVDLQGQGVALNMSLSASQPDAPQASGQAKLVGQTDQLQTRLELGLQTGQQAPAQGALDTGWWNSTAAGVGATWTPSSAARFEFGAQNSTRLDFTASDPIVGDGAQHYAQTRQSDLNAAATLSPLSPFDVKLGANLSSSLQQSVAVAGSGAETRDMAQTDSRQMSATVAWKPLAAVNLEAGGRVDATDLAWSGGRATAYAGLDPSAKLSLTPWSGGSLRLTLDRASTPLSQDQFLGYGQGGAEAYLSQVQPSREWRYGAAVSQKAGPIDLTASLLQARVQTFAYLAPMGANAARVGLGEGDRSELQAGLAAPLPLFGLAPFKLEAQATWRASQVQDPLTGAMGRLSGERPYDASLSLSQALGSGGLRWGVTARASGPQVNLGPTEVASLSSTAGLGGFLQYQTRPLTLRLSLDNLVGGERSERDVVYTGLRDLNVIDHTIENRTVDRAIHISLIRPL